MQEFRDTYEKDEAYDDNAKTHVNREIPFETDFLFCSYLYTGLKRSINDRSHVLMILNLLRNQPMNFPFP